MSHFTAYAHPISQRRYKDIIIWLCYSYSSFFNFCQYWQNVPVKLYYLMSPFFQAVAALAFRHFTEVYQEHYLFSFSLSIMATKLPYFQMFSPFKRGDINAIIQFNFNTNIIKGRNTMLDIFYIDGWFWFHMIYFHISTHVLSECHKAPRGRHSGASWRGGRHAWDANIYFENYQINAYFCIYKHSFFITRRVHTCQTIIMNYGHVNYNL